MGDATLLSGLVHSGGELGSALGNRRFALGGDVFALRELLRAEVLGRQVQAVFSHDPQAALQVAYHLNGAGYATALDVGHFSCIR